MLNVLVVSGRLTKEPLKTNAGETVIVNFDIAIDNIRKEADGTRGTTFLPVVCFNNIAENVIKHLHKGSKVGVSGSIQQRNFLRRDGSKGSVIEVIADSIEFLDPKQDAPVEELKEADLPEEEIPQQNAPEQKYDPYTGKPLKASKK